MTIEERLFSVPHAGETLYRARRLEEHLVDRMSLQEEA
jgi:hypothetical protein